MAWQFVVTTPLPPLQCANIQCCKRSEARELSVVWRLVTSKSNVQVMNARIRPPHTIQVCVKGASFKW